MTNKEYQRKLSKIKAKNRIIKMKRNLWKERLSIFPKISKPATSKIVLFSVILLNLQIIHFVEKAIMTYGDLSALYALIAIPATLVPTVWSFFSKSTKENTKGGIVYETAMAKFNSNTSAEQEECEQEEDLSDCSDE